MDKNFVKKYNLDEAVERFKKIANYHSPKQSLNEYTFLTKSLVDEEGEEDSQMPQNGSPAAQNQDGGMNGQGGGNMPTQGNEMPQNGNMQQPPMGGDTQQPPMGNDTQQPPMDGDMQQPPMGGDMQDQEMNDFGMPQGEEDGIETEEMEPEDEVIDVDDLTQSQEATEYKIDGVDDRLSQIYAVIQGFNDKLDQQQQNIMKLKDEFEKRNPTQTEKFNIRSQASGPYNQTPGDYWDKFESENPNYEIIRDNDVSPSDEQNKFEIRKGDISGLNMKNISDTLNLKQNLNDYLGF